MGGTPQATKVVVIKGSNSDNAITSDLIHALRGKGFSVEDRIASADNTSGHLTQVLNYLEERVRKGEAIMCVTAAGKRDALSGIVAARGFTTVAWAPDWEKLSFLEQGAKRWSSVSGPRGTVHFTTNIPDAVAKVEELAPLFNRAQTIELFNAAAQKRTQLMMADAELQGVARALPYTFIKAGKVRIVYIDGEYLILDCSDDISAFEAKAKQKIPEKGKWLNLLSAWWFELIKDIAPTHFVGLEGDTAMRVKKTQRVNVEFIVRGHIYGSMWRAYEKGQREFYGVTLPDGLQKGSKLPAPMVTPTTKEERPGRHDDPISKEEAVITDRLNGPHWEKYQKGEREFFGPAHMVTLPNGLQEGDKLPEQIGVCTAEEWDKCSEYTLKIYDRIVAKAGEVGLLVPDFKLEFGKLPDGTIIVIDEMPTHDSARFWQASKFVPGQGQEAWCLDKEFLREYLQRTGFDIKGKATELPALPQLVVDQIAKRAKGAYEVLVEGKKLEDLGLMSVDEVIEAVKRQAQAPAVEPPATA